MDKFWLWMEDKKYYHNGHTYSESLCDKEFFKNHKQMLIGYMIEYLIEKSKKINNKGISITNYHSIELLYDNLIEMIEKTKDKR